MKRIFFALIVTLSVFTMAYAENNNVKIEENLNRSDSVAISQVRKVADIIQELAVPDMESKGRIVHFER